jgi:lipopolysaccharide export system permease protein
MKIIDRYLIRSFAAPFGICVAIFCLLVLLGRFFDKMSIFNQFHAGILDIVVYLLLSLPFWLNIVLPMATMLALLFSLGHLQAGGEITAMRSAGIRPTRLYRPFFIAGLVLVVISLVGGLSFLPKLNFESRVIYRVKIKKRDLLDYQRDNIVAAGQGNRHYTIGWLDVDKQSMKNVVVDRFDDQDHLVETLTTQEAFYEDHHWRFTKGILRRYPNGDMDKAVEESFETRFFDIPERPGDFALVDKLTDDMTGGELMRRIRRLRLLGSPVHKEWVALHMRIALPFSNLVVIALAIPFVMTANQKTQSRTQTFSYAFAMAFLFWGFTSACQSLGEQGRIPAWVAAWLSNAVFGVIAAWRLVRTTT